MLKPGEVDAPQGLKAGLKAANRLQDLTMQFATVGRTGNQALRDARMQAVKEGLVPSIYCHAIGYHGHAAGPPIGMTDCQEVRFALEEDAALMPDGSGSWVLERQDHFPLTEPGPKM